MDVIGTVIFGVSRQSFEQCFTDAAAAEPRPHVKVFEIDAGARGEGRVSAPPDHHARDRSIHFGDIADDAAALADEVAGDAFGRQLENVREALELRELLQQRKNVLCIARSSVTDDEVTAHTATGALMCGCDW